MPHPRLWDAKLLSLATQSILDILTWFLVLHVELSKSYVCNQKSLYHVKNWRRYSTAKFGLPSAQKVAYQVVCFACHNKSGLPSCRRPLFSTYYNFCNTASNWVIAGSMECAWRALQTMRFLKYQNHGCIGRCNCKMWLSQKISNLRAYLILYPAS